MDSNDEAPSEISASYRRRFLQGVGATGLGGVLAGCLGGDDEPADDEDDDEPENGDDEPEPATFEIDELHPGDEAVTRGDDVEVAATVSNAGEEEGTREVELELDGELEGSADLTLGGGESEELDLGVVDTAELTVDDYEYAVRTGDDEAMASLTVGEVLGDDPDPLLSLDDDEVGLGTQTVTGSLDNPYAVALEDGAVELEGPEEWEITPVSGTEFETLDVLDSQSVEWEFEVPEDAEDEQELTAHVSYASANEDADVTTTLSITPDVWEGVSFVEVLHFEDFWDGIEDRTHEDDDGNVIEGQIEWFDYEADLSGFLPATDVQLLFEDSYPGDGWGPSVLETTVYADGEEIHTIVPFTDEEEEEYLAEDGGSQQDSSDEDGEWRFADADSYWIYEFDVPEDTEELSVEITMRNGFVISARAIPDTPVEGALPTQGLVSHFDAARLGGDDGEAVAAWPDDGEAGLDLTQDEEDAQPTFQEDVAGGNGVVRFEGDGDFGEGDYVAADDVPTDDAAGVTLATVFQTHDVTVQRQTVVYNGSDDAGTGYGIFVNNEADDGPEPEGYIHALYGGVNWWWSDTQVEENQFHVATLTIPEDAPDAPVLRLDGEVAQLEAQVGEEPPEPPTDQIAIGTDDGEFAPPYFHGDVGEVAVYDRELPEEEREILEDYLAGKWEA